ncbi:MAG: hypothetical protein K2Q09_03835 [Phycisphaerales bacterium]|nr:hypothetical protein [Phycisphaerales bacterium]
MVNRRPVQIDNKIFEPSHRILPVYYHQDSQTKEEWVLFPSPVGIYITSGIDGAKMEPIASISEDKKTIHFSSIQFDESFSSIYQKSSPNYLLLRTNEIKNLNHQTAEKDLSSEKQENQEKTKITYTQEELDLLKKIPNPPKPYSNKQVILPMSSDQVPILSSNMTSKQDKKMVLEKDKKMDLEKDQKTGLKDDFEANQKTEENLNNKQILKSDHKEYQQQNKNTTIIDSNFESSVENGITKEISISKDVDGSNLKTNQPKSSIYQQQKQTASIPFPNKILIPSDDGVQSLSRIGQYYNKITQPSNNYIELSDTSSETDEIHSSKPNETSSSKPPNPTISSHSQQSIPSSTKRQNKQESIVDPQSIEESNNEESNLESIHQGLNLESIHQGLNLESIHQGLNLESNKEFKIIEKKNFSNLINTFSSNKSFHSFFIIPHPPNHDCYFDLIPRKVNEFLTLLKIRDLSESSNNNNNNNKKFKLELKDKASSETLIKWYPPKLLTQKRFLLRTKDGYLIKTKQKNQKNNNNNNNNNNNKNIKESQENEQIFIPVIWFEYRNPSTQSYIPYHFHQGSRWISKTKFIDICHSPDSNAIDEFLESISSQSKEDFIRTLLEPLSHVIQLDDKASPYIQNGFFLPIPNHQAGSFQNPQLDPNSIVFLSIKDIFPWPLYIPGQQFDSSNTPSYLQKYLDPSFANQNSNNNSIHSDRISNNNNNNNNNNKISVDKIKISNLVQDTENDIDDEQSFEDIQTGINLCLLLKFYDLTNIEFFLKSSTHSIVFKKFEVGFIGSYNRNTQTCVQFSPSDKNLSEEKYKTELTLFMKSMSWNSFLLIRFDHVLPVGNYNFPTTHHSSKKPNSNKYEYISIFYNHRSIEFSYFISTSRIQMIKVFYKFIHPNQ